MLDKIIAAKYMLVIFLKGFSGGSVIKNLPANAEDTGDAGLISGRGRSPGVKMETHSSILAWKIPWTEEQSRLQSMGS